MQLKDQITAQPFFENTKLTTTRILKNGDKQD